MSKFALKIHFIIESTGLLNDDVDKIQFENPLGHPIILKSRKPENIVDSNVFYLFSTGYLDESEAMSTALKIKKALLISSVINQLGIKMGEAQKGIEVYEDVGIRVDLYAEGTVSGPSKSARIIMNDIVKMEFLNIQLSEKDSLALELASSASFESSARSHFLIYVSALEYMAVQDPLNKKVQVMIDELIKEINDRDLINNASDLENGKKKKDEEKKLKHSLVSRIGRLKSESIGSSIRKLVGKYLHGYEYKGLSPEKFINEIYNVRSEITHNGKVDDDVNLGEWQRELSILFTDLIKEKFQLK